MIAMRSKRLLLSSPRGFLPQSFNIEISWKRPSFRWLVSAGRFADIVSIKRFITRPFPSPTFWTLGAFGGHVVTIGQTFPGAIISFKIPGRSLLWASSRTVNLVVLHVITQRASGSVWIPGYRDIKIFHASPFRSTFLHFYRSLVASTTLNGSLYRIVNWCGRMVSIEFIFPRFSPFLLPYRLFLLLGLSGRKLVIRFYRSTSKGIGATMIC